MSSDDETAKSTTDSAGSEVSESTSEGRYWYCPCCELGNTLFESECYACKRVQKLEEVSPILKELCLCSVQEWSKLNKDDLEIDFLIGGQSNRLFTVTVIGDTTHKDDDNNFDKDNITSSSKKGVIRLFNPRMPLSKEQLQCVFKAFQESGLGTRIMGSFGSGFGHVEEFIHGHRVSDLDLLSSKSDSLCIARQFGRIHHFEIDHKTFDITMDDRILSLIERVVHFLSSRITDIKNHWLWHLGYELRPPSWQRNVFDPSMIDDNFDLHLLLNKMWNRIKSSLDLSCERTVKESGLLVKTTTMNDDSNHQLSKHSLVLGNEQVFCHCDLHSGNVIRMESDSTDFKVIDYEYARFAPRVFDLGNHFNEYWFDNFYEDAPYFKLREERRPDEQFTDDFLNEYVRSVIDLRKKKRMNPMLLNDCDDRNEDSMDPDSSAEGYSVEMDHHNDSHLNHTGDTNHTLNSNNNNSRMNSGKEGVIKASVRGLKTSLKWGQVMSGFHWTLWSILESERTDVEWGYAEYGHSRWMELWRVIHSLSKDEVDSIAREL